MPNSPLLEPSAAGLEPESVRVRRGAAGLVLVDDHSRFREATASALRVDPAVQILGQGKCADDALRLARDLQPDLMLLDITMPGNGLCAARAIRATFPDIRIIMLTFSAAEDDVNAALAAGAQGYVLKGVGGRSLLRIVQAVLRREHYLAPELTGLLLLR
ncbi:response regulator [Deinococcus koreensis]|uniref:response regulator n=1 Tax=Deinococcus koreensis TaxID=2054903 RepID=UPI0013FDF662|nr:response regulator transcription factor [Deinococcus koreensis]